MKLELLIPAVAAVASLGDAASRGTSFCENSGAATPVFGGGSCPPVAELADAPVCSVRVAADQKYQLLAPAAGVDWSRELTASTACRCDPANVDGLLGCDVETRDAATGVVSAYFVCNSRVVYDGTGGVRSDFCAQYTRVENWASTTRAGNTNDPERRYDGDSWAKWKCYGNLWYDWNPTGDRKCRDQERYIGEVCWDGSWGWGGQCHNPDQSYADNALSCYTRPGEQRASCVPAVYPGIARNSCTCNLFDWWFFGIACGSDDCNGHACVLNSGDGNKYCDYNTKNNWRRG